MTKGGFGLGDIARCMGKVIGWSDLGSVNDSALFRVVLYGGGVLKVGEG